MKVICDGLDFSDAILKVSKGISVRSTNPVLEGIKLTAEEDHLTLNATDLEFYIEKKIKANVQIEGEIVVPGKFISEYVRKISNEQIELSVDSNNVMSIIYADSVGKIMCLKADEFPAVKEINFENNFEISQKNLKSIINKSIFSVALDDSRPILKGCKIEVGDGVAVAVALDGYRLAKVQKPIISSTGKFEVIVPAKSLSEISKILDDSDNPVKLYIHKNYLMIDVDNTKITTRLLDGNFINYKQIIPSSYTSNVIINKDQFLDAIEKASLLSRVDKNNLIRFEIRDKLLVLTSQSEMGDFKENITIALTGKDITIAFNARYFSDVLKVTTDEFLKLNFTSNTSPCIITSTEGEEILYLILPVRII